VLQVEAVVLDERVARDVDRLVRVVHDAVLRERRVLQPLGVRRHALRDQRVDVGVDTERLGLGRVHVDVPRRRVQDRVVLAHLGRHQQRVRLLRLEREELSRRRQLSDARGGRRRRLGEHVARAVAIAVLV
jgi:hypothetical protein